MGRILRSQRTLRSLKKAMKRGAAAFFSKLRQGLGLLFVCAVIFAMPIWSIVQAGSIFSRHKLVHKTTSPISHAVKTTDQSILLPASDIRIVSASQALAFSRYVGDESR